MRFFSAIVAAVLSATAAQACVSSYQCPKGYVCDMSRLSPTYKKCVKVGRMFLDDGAFEEMLEDDDVKETETIRIEVLLGDEISIACRSSYQCPKGKVCDQQRGSPTFGKCV